MDTVWQGKALAVSCLLLSKLLATLHGVGLDHGLPATSSPVRAAQSHTMSMSDELRSDALFRLKIQDKFNSDLSRHKPRSICQAGRDTTPGPVYSCHELR